MATLNDKAVGDIVKINENNTAVNYIIVHKGKPGSLYDGSCDGVWLLRQQAYPKMMWNTARNNAYESSEINTWLNGVFLNTFDENLQKKIKTVKIPFKKNCGLQDPLDIQSGSDGLSCKVFSLSGYEVGFTVIDNQYFPIDGAKLSYFSDNTSRIAKDSSGSDVEWWLRSTYTGNNQNVWRIKTSGEFYSYYPNDATVALRPAFVLPSNLFVAADGSVSGNCHPTITSDKTGNLGALTEGFTCKYSVNDEDAADALTVTLTLDSDVIKTFTATNGAQNTYALTGADWLKITNGSHTFKISVTDGKSTEISTAAFTRACHLLSVTLAEPLAADDRISACSLKVDGIIPEDAFCAYEVTNNANDSSPVWEDCTEKVKNNLPHVFGNKTAENGFAFNFRVAIQRGASNEGGCIVRISGGFK
ncbi:MAG: DUF6273 domain-containing protein [Lachnospiraceae bacterium]|nr:DUF6273 domain-containing protein [Ruminococcus sp.]MCM1276390.1 DUF6273 domain-containing protein [Lachnospiraceae bacterium]